MKILIVGATGLIGGAVANALSANHEIISAGYSDGDVKVDLGSKASINAMFTAIGKVDAVISTAGLAGFAPFNELDDAAYDLALSNKLMGQVNLVRVGQDHVSDDGSFVLTAGILSRQPMPGSVVISMANGALESFAKAASLELDRGLRVNTVSPVFVKETMVKMGMDPRSGLSAADTAKAYVAAVTGNMNGETLDAPDFA
ncbi:short chain dehydrogenase [Pseudorhodobacter turbinis]|uniref:Short chain dehydrogenase n=1 Tax=Pseudorhodobacter turbinis TaxID=2500533 RepID=A0A4P8EF04_9RHOB|nr:short chain dehydrogenase [Pseudorhodobacter turbinis]QCO55426.1 short chain dehydrogenase [Pseudorhodobacter turbinis]